MDSRFGAAGDHDIREALLQVLVGVRDGLGARRARGDDGADSGASLDVHPDRGSGSVWHEHGNRERHDAARSLLAQGVPGVKQRPHAADARCPVDEETLGGDIANREAGVGKCLTTRDERELA